MSFNWMSFVKKYNIPYVEVGANVSRGNLNIHCPFCGGSDPSEHMGLQKEGRYWGCWRVKSHRGKSPHRLIMALTGCTYSESLSIVGESFVNLSDFEKAVDALRTPTGVEVKKDHKLSFPKAFRDIRDRGITLKFWNYLKKRGFREVDALCDAYDLQCCLSGNWRSRIIIPVYIKRKLVCWTGRTISKENPVRYKTLSHSPEKASEEKDPLAVMNIRHTILNYDSLMETGGRRLIIGEGPLDALKVDFYGRDYDTRSTCIFGTSVTAQQTELLENLVRRFDEMVVILDPGQLGNSWRFLGSASHLDIQAKPVPDGIEDLGAMTKKQVRELLV